MYQHLCKAQADLTGSVLDAQLTMCLSRCSALLMHHCTRTGEPEERISLGSQSKLPWPTTKTSAADQWTSRGDWSGSG